ncbi:OmpW family protein [Alcanivorax sp. 1008]|uniref:OmpW/AlkL family protein n=1 Tax=Alcanivorax sp. 1008 TaxID=2816853 RepID=UPI001D5414FC|nr:OmpW family outer membrane protein [Alcanivorax sp. 1008]MCC1497395.1 outer membrane beta-barrel protein [Alcanivorax sp. 1008]
MKALRPTLLAVAVSCLAAPALAYEAGDVIVRFGPALVAPDSSSDPDLVEVDNGVGFGISATYMVHNSVGVELLGALPFEHDLNGSGGLAGVDVGSTEHLPPTLLVNYYPNVSEKFQPYVGVGFNYTMFFREKTDPELDAALGGNTDLRLSDSTGIAYEAGFDIPMSDNMMFSASVWNVAIDTTARVTVNGAPAAKIDVEIDPWVYMVGIGIKF